MATTARSRGVFLYGPPASGKDTITHALHELDDRYELFPRLKVGPGRTAGYRATSTQHLAELRTAGHLLWENNRYGSTYAVDRDELMRCLAIQIPVLHVGQPRSLEVIKAATPSAQWLAVDLRVPRQIAAQRLYARGATDVSDRLQAWEQTPNLEYADVLLDTSSTTPEEAARRIVDAVRANLERDR